MLRSATEMSTDARVEVSFEEAIRHLVSLHDLEVAQLRKSQEILLQQIAELEESSRRCLLQDAGRVLSASGPSRVRKMTLESRCLVTPEGEQPDDPVGEVQISKDQAHEKTGEWSSCALPSGQCPPDVEATVADDEEVPTPSVESHDEANGAALKASRRSQLKDSLMSTASGVAQQRIMGDDVHDGSPWSLLAIVTHQYFNVAVACLIIFNSFFICIEVEWMSTHAIVPWWIEIVSYACSAFFGCELVVRIIALRTDFLADKSTRLWNIFDTVLVMTSVCEPIVNAALNDKQNLSMLASMKILKMLRVIRVFRVLRFLRQLMKIVLMIIDSFKSLVWAIALNAFITYVFCISLTMRSVDWLKLQVDMSSPDWLSDLRNSNDATVIAINTHYANLSTTLYTLTLTVMGGISWHEVCDPLMSIDWLSAALLLTYILFMMLAVLNIITAVFVDSAYRSAERQRDLKIKEEIDRQDEYMDQIREFFEALDEDSSGEVSPEELKDLLTDSTLNAYFRVLGFDIDDASRFIKLLDKDRSGSVSVNEFLDGCMRFKGPAQGVDVHTILYELKTVSTNVEKLLQEQEVRNKKLKPLRAGEREL